jgi:signal transduction histidine kinase
VTEPVAERIAPAGTVFAAPDGRVTTHTPRFAELVGRAGADLRGTPVADLLPVVLGARPVFAELPDVIDGHTVDGRHITFVVETLPDGGRCLAAADVTGAHAISDALRRARREAEAANGVKSRVLATISHELRTPLNAVIGFSDALTQPQPGGKPLSGERVREYALAIRDAGHVLLRQINNILDVVRLESGGIHLAGDVIELSRLIEAAVRQSAPAARAAEIALQAPPCTVRSWLRGDERRLRQVLGHLLANALKYTPHGGTIAVETTLAEDGDLLMQVRDSGVGIAESDLTRVFEPFGEDDGTAARRSPGVGFGLYFSRAIVEAHGGKLTLASDVGAGTTVTLSLPRSRLIPPTPASRQLQESP